MAQNFLSCDRDQAWLMPPSMRDWLPDGHLAWFVIETVAGLDLAAIRGVYREDGQGRPAHDPAMMVALLLYAYAVGVPSSRKIEARCVEDVAFRVIAGNRRPDHVTIARFRGRHAAALAGLFGQVLGLCVRAGLVRVGTVAIDGTKMAANAGPGANRGYDALRAEAQRWLDEAAEVDAREDELFGEQRGDELPAELADPRSRKRRIRELLDELEREQGEAETAHGEYVEQRVRSDQTGKRRGGKWPRRPAPISERRRNTTDPDSRIMQHRGMKLQGYNAQAAVADGQVILAVDVVNARNDGAQLGPMTEQVEQSLARLGIPDRPGTVLADGAYFNNAHIRGLIKQGIEVLIPPRRHQIGPLAARMRERLDDDEGKRRYRRRQAIVEPVFAVLKHHRRLDRFARRGLTAVRHEFALMATTHNLRKLHTAALAG